MNVGCIPKKLMHTAGIMGASVHEAQSFGWATENKGHNWWVTGHSPRPATAHCLPPHVPRSRVVAEAARLPFCRSKMVENVQGHIKSLNWNYKVQLRDEKVEYKNECV